MAMGYAWTAPDYKGQIISRSYLDAGLLASTEMILDTDN